MQGSWQPSGDHRPVACGWGSLAPLNRETVAATYASRFRAHLEPLQLGVGTRLGCEAMVHVARQRLSRNAGELDKVLVKLDLSSAVNIVDRSAIISVVRSAVPELAPCADGCYRHPSALRLSEHTFVSERGVQQGDPLGPALFALAITTRYCGPENDTAIAHPDGIDFVSFYLDDGVFVGSGDAVAHFSTSLQHELAGLCLELSFAKCAVLAPVGQGFIGSVPGLDGAIWVRSDGIELLGALLGQADFCSAPPKIRDKAQPLLSAIKSFGHTQGALILLRNCASFSKVAYAMRTVQPVLQQAHFEADIRGVLEELVRGSVPELSRSLAQPSMQHGGLGLRASGRHAPAAYLASVWQSQSLRRAIDH